MSVLLEFAMFPTDKGISVSDYVSRVIEYIRDTGYEYRLTAMGTIVETETLSEALAIVEKSYSILEPYSDRVYSNIKLDIRKDRKDRIVGKIQSIEQKIGKVKS